MQKIRKDELPDYYQNEQHMHEILVQPNNNPRT